MKKLTILIICIFTIILLFACGSEDLDNSSEFIESDDNSKQGESQESSIEESSAEESSIEEESSEESIDYLNSYEVIDDLCDGKFYIIADKEKYTYTAFALVNSNNELIIDFSDCNIYKRYDMIIADYNVKGFTEMSTAINLEGETVIPLNTYKSVYYTGNYFMARTLESTDFDSEYVIIRKNGTVFETDFTIKSHLTYEQVGDPDTNDIWDTNDEIYQLHYDTEAERIILERFDKSKAVEDNLETFVSMIKRAVEAAKTDDREALAELLTEELYNNYVDYLNGDKAAAYKNGIFWLINEDGTGEIDVVHKEFKGNYEEYFKSIIDHMFRVNLRKGGATTLYFYWEHMEPEQQRGAYFISDGEDNFKISEYIYGLDM